MFFNIYNIILTMFKFFFKFFFFLKYITPFLYSILDKNLNNLINSNSLRKGYPTKKYLNINKLKSYNFNDFYKNINTNVGINTLSINWFIFNRIINQNSNNFKVGEILFLHSFVSFNLNRFANVKLLSCGNFSNYQKINLIINNSTVSTRTLNSKTNRFYNINYLKGIKNKLNNLIIDYKPRVRINNIINNWALKFNSTSIDKLLSTSQVYNVLFIRNFKVFNKGRYSRNRQYYRTGVY